MPLFDLSPKPITAAPRDAATLIVVRDTDCGLEVFCVKRHEKSAFMGGAIVFPGGKVDALDDDSAWVRLTTDPKPRGEPFASGALSLRALAIAACRESLEEAHLLPVDGGALSHDDLVTIHRTARTDNTFHPTLLRQALAARELKLDLAALTPFARWITPTRESRRFDTRFFLVEAPHSQVGLHDRHETTDSFWAPPNRVLDQFAASQVQLAPPTHRVLEILASVRSVAEATALANTFSLEPICPELVVHEDGQPRALTLPGDPEHSVSSLRTPGKTRFTLHEGRWFPSDPPHPLNSPLDRRSQRS